MAARHRHTHRLAQLLAVALLACPAGKPAQTDSPDEAEQKRILEAIEDYADQYIAALPNFICDQITRQYHAGKKPDHWRKGDVLTSRLLYANGHEQRNLELVNDKPVRPGMRPWRVPLETQGEFGILVGSIFSPGSQASVSFKGWDTVRGTRVAVFAFAIDAQHSKMTLSSDDLVKVTLPYHGTVYGNPQTGAILRITDSETNLPKELRTEKISRVVDFDNVSIAGKTYLLPVQASIWMTTDANNLRNELEFRNYRKFEAESVIRFASADQPAGGAVNPKN